MDFIQELQNITWCKDIWDLPNIKDDVKILLKECQHVTKPEITDDVQDVIKRSREFPVQFPIDTVRLENLQLSIPLDTLNENIRTTYPIIHERILTLLADFLLYKRKHGSSIEKDLYKDMSIIDFIDRILTKRSVVFMKKQDVYKLLNGEKGEGGWENIGTVEEQPPLVLADCLSYDEMKVSAMVSVSGPTACINDGARKNHGIVCTDNVELDVIIIGIIGPRFHRPGKVDCEDILITEKQNQADNGYGASIEPKNAKQIWRQIWTDFYQINSSTYSEVSSLGTDGPYRDSRAFTQRWSRRARATDLFDATAYHRRLTIIADLALLEANARAAATGKHAFVNLVGAGLGAWQISPHQLDLYVLSFLHRINFLLKKGALNNVSDINFAYIEPADFVKKLFIAESEDVERLFLAWAFHPKGGINVQLQNREPSSALTGRHAGKLLVLTYPWDGNAHPGNEFWIGKLSSSGDGAAACSTQVAELHNAHVNKRAVCACNTHVVGDRGLMHIGDYCKLLTV